ncbi:MAG: carbamate kinase [Bacteroidales bacterium]
MGKLAVIALGGNALLRGTQDGTIEEQEQNTKDTLENLIYLVKEGYDIVISHGNGPQVGNILMRNDAGFENYQIPQMPLDVCVADSQGGIGYMIERMLRNVMVDHHLKRDVVTIVTQVVVDKDDQAFKNPTKRIGRNYTKDQADELSRTKGWVFKEDSKVQGGYRRVVPSPEPIEVFNAKSIETLARQGTIVIAAGGGGIPVYFDENNYVRTLDAVIDKDMASSLLATTINADEFYILTDVPYIFLDFKKPSQRIAEFLNVADAKKYLAEGQFGEGSMAPKIKAAIKFVENGGSKSVITESTKLEDRRYGSKITMEYD